MNDELKQKILAEINKSGFSHELNIIQRLRNEELTVFPNLGYVDSEDKPHEIDAFAIINDYDEEKRFDDVSLNLIVECKSSSDKPWVFFDDPEDALSLLGLADRLEYVSNFETKDGYTPLTGCMNSALSGHHYNNKTTPVARTHFEAFGKDAGKEIYQGITSLWYTLDYFKRLFGKSTINQVVQKQRIDFIHPVIVLKGVLITAFRNDEGEFEVEEVPHVMIKTIDCITDKELDFRVTNEIIVDVVRSDYLEEYIKICQNDFKLCKAHIKQLIQAGWLINSAIPST